MKTAVAWWHRARGAATERGVGWSEGGVAGAGPPGAEARSEEEAPEAFPVGGHA